MRVLVCGSRDWTDKGAIEAVLDGLFVRRVDPLVVLEGGAKGADAIAGEWAQNWSSRDHLTFPANWQAHANAAGPIRNQKMLDEGQPDVVWAFVTKPLAESRGTADMVRRAKAAGIPVYVVQKV